MSTGTLILAAPWFTALDDNGDPIVGALLNFYYTGTSSRAPIYHDAALATPWTNPAVCDSAGRCVVYTGAISVKLIATDADGVQFGPTVDPIVSQLVGQAGGNGEIFVLGGDPTSPVTATSYPSGATADKLCAGSGIWSIDSGNLPGTYALQTMGIGNGGTLTVALVNLSDGAPDTPLVTVTSTSTTGAQLTSAAITFPAAGTTKDYGIKAKVSTAYGNQWLAKIVRTS